MRKWYSNQDVIQDYKNLKLMVLLSDDCFVMGNALLSRIQDIRSVLDSFSNFEIFAASGSNNRTASTTLSFSPTFLIATIIIGEGSSNTYDNTDSVILYDIYIPASGYKIQYGQKDNCYVNCTFRGATLTFSSGNGQPSASGIAILL